MTSRERFRKAVSFKEPDRVPIESNSTVSTLHEVAYKKLIDYLGYEEDKIIISCPTQRAVQSSERVLQRLSVDTRVIYANAPSNWKYEEQPDGSWKDEFGTFMRKCGLYCDIEKPILKNASLNDIKKYKFPDPTDPVRFEGLKDKAKEMYEKTNYAIVAGNQFAIYYIAWVLRGIQQFTEDIVLNPKLANYLMEKIVDWNIKFLDSYLTAIGEYVEYVWIVDDWGVQSGPFISPEMFRETIVPKFKKISDFIKTKTSAKIMMHTCGATYWMLNDLIEMGVDMVHPVQANASGNEDPRILKRDFGGKIVIHGNTNNQGVFHKSKEEVIADALYRIKYLAPGGGYIFSSGHNIQANMSPENILALFDTALEYGTYPINIEKIDNKLQELSRIKPEIKNQIKI